MAKVTQSNPDAFAHLKLGLKALAGVEGSVGWFPSARYEDDTADGTPVAYVAAIQELGANAAGIIIPPRPFLRPTAIAKKQEWTEVAAREALAVIKGEQTAMQAMERLTAKAEGDVLKTIVSITQPPLSPVTIELRAMKKRKPGMKVSRATVGEAARRVAQSGYQKPNVSEKPLNDSGHMIATLTHVVDKL